MRTWDFRSAPTLLNYRSMRTRTALLFLVLLLASVAAPLAYAADVPVLDGSFHIVPDASDIDPLCPAGAPLSYGAVMEIIQRFMNAAISFGILICVIIIAWSGFLFITSVTNPESRNKARGMLTNAGIGLLIVLSAWLMVDFVMKVLYSGPDGTEGKFGPWNSILGTGPACIIGRPTQALFTGEITAVEVTAPVVAGQTSDGFFTYQPGIQAQRVHASAKLNTLLSCMATKVPARVGNISSISDSAIINGTKTFQQCAASGCAHTKNSCHYGGSKCVGSSYAVDFGDEQNIPALTAAARACGADYVGNEGNHLHVSVGAGCSCN